ncbi:metal ABC transporter ATP-binding protein [Paenibacillus senegalensis]|uniref:metal ABC transporter ATP-binding protein n=1 Tax=Paenibacillus senegalensis TaxID=1465766 RepID=UPI0002886902|nr:metal ABC transporter ATP-binding protein [Paenibacillus senegalensis]
MVTAVDRSPCHDNVVEISQLTFAYNRNEVIRNLDLQIQQRDFVGIVGANGAGKTTLLKMIVGLIKPSSGQIKLFGEPLSQFKDWERIGYVPQTNSFNPLFPATVKEVVLSGLYGRKKLFKRLTKQDHQKCDEALRTMNIADLADRKIGQLSGGQQQRAFLARAFINRPDLLILDEPTVGIDRQTQDSFIQLIRHMHERHDITFLMVSHDMEMMQSYLGSEAAYQAGKLNFYIRHTHNPEDCEVPGLVHALADQQQAAEQNGSRPGLLDENELIKMK